jgi:hypothetical protein
MLFPFRAVHVRTRKVAEIVHAEGNPYSRVPGEAE